MLLFQTISYFHWTNRRTYWHLEYLTNLSVGHYYPQKAYLIASESSSMERHRGQNGWWYSCLWSNCRYYVLVVEYEVVECLNIC